jgi:hypothetical protein
MATEELDWDLLSRVAMEMWGLGFASPQQEAALGAKLPTLEHRADGSSLVAGTPRLVVLSGVRVPDKQLVWVFAWWPVPRRSVPCVWVTVLSAQDSSELRTFWFSLPVTFPMPVTASALNAE